MYVVVCNRVSDGNLYEADDWFVGDDENLNILKDGKLIATHAAGSWESVHLSEVENG